MNNTTSPTPSRHHGFTLIEMLVVIAIIGLLAGIMIPAITKSLTRAKETTKSSNLRAMYQGNSIYIAENRGRICPVSDEKNYEGDGRNWRDILSEYMAKKTESRGAANDEKLFIDSFFAYNPNEKHATGFGMNRNPGLPESSHSNVLTQNDNNYERGFYIESITRPGERIFIGDVVAGRWFISKQQPALDTTRHDGKGMFLMFDGSVKKLDATEAQQAFLDPK